METIRQFITHPVAFLRGVYEFHRECTWADPDRADGDYTEKDEAYDYGRDFAHRVTLRQFEA